MKKTMSKKILSPLRRDGYKAGMIMMLIALSTMLLTTACSSEDDLVNNTANTENTINKGYALPVTVNVTRGDGATRASYNESTGKLAFSAGDKLFVWGSASGAGKFAGTLDYVSASGKFSGTITTQNSYEGDFETLFTAATEAHTIEADLLPAGYEDYEFLGIVNSGYEAQLGIAFTKAFATSTAVKTAKALAVEQFSCEDSYAYDNGFALSPDFAILNFTITGLSASTDDVNVTFTGTAQNITNSVTTDADGKATFAIGINPYYDLTDYSLTVGGNAITITSTSKTPVAGKIYNISRSAASVPEGALSGVFSVGDTKKVYFSKGNLQATYNGSSWSWAFAANQYDYIGNAEGNTKVSDSDPFVTGYTGSSTTVDLFGWSTSTTYLGIHISRNDVDYSGGFVDWGATMGSGWCTLSKDEWLHLFNIRSASTVGGTENGRYAKAKVNGVWGVILFPDTYTHPDGVTAPTGVNATNSTGWNGNSYTVADWTKMESAGCVFLPAAGYRDEADVYVDGDDEDDGYYWSSLAKGDEEAYNVYFSSSDLILENFTDRYNGFSVRLVRPVQ
jgi:hypothetical protein